MLKEQKERVVEQLAQRLRDSDTLMVADYRGLTMPEIDELRTRLLEAGARFTVVKNTLTRRAAEAAGKQEVLDLIDGPTAIAFLNPEGDPAAVAKVLNDTAKANDVLVIRGGVLEGTVVGDVEIKRLATLPPADVLRGQLVGAIAGPLTTVVGLFTAPLRDLVGVLDARIRQLEEQGETVPEPEAEAAPEAPAEEPAAEEPAVEEPAAEEPATEEPAAEEAPSDEAAQDETEEPPAEETGPEAEQEEEQSG
jgi:large subunit ribosomal protein L10